MRKELDYAVGEKQAFNTEYRIKRKDGQINWYKISSSIYNDEEGIPAKMLGISIDITDIKNMQEKLERQNVELRELDEMKNRFISTISHELRTPITSFRGYLEIIEDQKAELPKDVQRYIEILERNTNRLVTLTDDLLDQQRIQTGRLQINPQPVDINKIILDSVNEIRIFTDTKDIKIKTNIREDIPHIEADPVRVQQILVNLLHNAFKFSQENSTITVTETHDNDFVHISVSDKGVGLTEKQLSILFKPFPGIVHDSNIVGTGLGLSICKGLIELHKGKIWAESEGLEKGTTFHFTLPVNG